MKTNKTMWWKIKNFFTRKKGPKIEVNVDLLKRMDLLNHEVSDEQKEELREKLQPEYSDVMESIVNNRRLSIDEAFNSLPLSRISDNAKVQIIDIVHNDLSNLTKRYENVYEDLKSKIKL